MENKILVRGIDVRIKTINSQEYISLTDIAKKKNIEEPRFVVINWLRNRDTVEFLGLWENINNENFNRIGFDTVRIKAGLSSYTISPSKWIEKTNAIGLITKSGKYDSGTFAHKDIALEFASWVSVEFKLYLIKEFQRLKEKENKNQPELSGTPYKVLLFLPELTGTEKKWLEVRGKWQELKNNFFLPPSSHPQPTTS